MTSIFKPEGSLVAGLAVVGLVWANYSLSMGSMATVHMTGANDNVAESSRKKAGWSSLVLVAGVSLLARDPNIFILGTGAIIAMEVNARHAIMSNSDTGKIELPTVTDYAPAGSTGS